MFLPQSVRMPRLAPAFSRTDEISFKLVGVVPLLSGATLLTFSSRNKLPQRRYPWLSRCHCSLL